MELCSRNGRKTNYVRLTLPHDSTADYRSHPLASEPWRSYLADGDAKYRMVTPQKRKGWPKATRSRPSPPCPLPRGPPIFAMPSRAVTWDQAGGRTSGQTGPAQRCRLRPGAMNHLFHLPLEVPLCNRAPSCVLPEHSRAKAFLPLPWAQTEVPAGRKPHVPQQVE